ncbi:MAG: sulfatase-like hydrolase/transferase [Vicinamibacterales bacterium]
MRGVGRLALGLVGLALAAGGCGPGLPAPGGAAGDSGPAPRHLVLVTIDTLRADRVGAYGHATARTPVLDTLARTGLRLTRAYAAAPITLPSHASLLSGRYPPAHGARHNGVAMAGDVPTLATLLREAGFSTAAFVAAFPLDRRFGLARGFEVYGDRLPRLASGRPADERPGASVVDEALAWRRAAGTGRTFLWVHVFEPHAPYGDATSGRPMALRYDDEIAEADRQVGRLLDGLGADRAATLVVVASDHGEAFGEHGEIGHSLFVYDTTLHVPLILQGPGVPAGVDDRAVSLVDVAPTVLGLLGVAAPEMDGRAFTGPAAAADSGRVLYAESEAPRLDFGWSPLRAVRLGGLKYILAPAPELYDLEADPGETTDLSGERAADAAALRARAIDAARPPAGALAAAAPDAEARRRLGALGYLGGAGTTPGRALVDPKDRRALAARLAQVTSGELAGPALERALEGIVRDDPDNPQARVRLGFALADRGQCGPAVPHFRAAIAAGMPTADASLGLAGCLAAGRQFTAAADVLRQGASVEPDNPVVVANLGAVLSDGGEPLAGIPHLQRALELDPDLHQARFTLAIAHARAGHRAEAMAETEVLLERLPEGSPQRPEVERLLEALR